jgi:hypothetical protein
VTERPTRETAAGRADLDLQNLARRSGRPTDELDQLHALEGSLDRLTRSTHADRFVLKAVCSSPPSTRADSPETSR